MMRDPELEMEVDELCNLNTNRDPTEKEMYDIYCWIDHLEFTRPKRNISRDFSDGVLMAELIATYLPRIVELRYYYAGLSKKNKTNNWEHLNMKVFSKIGYKIGKQQMIDIMESTPGAIEKVLFQLRSLIARRNRSILNYRVGLKPELPEMAEKAPGIPSALTYSTAIKRRERSLSSQPRTLQHHENLPRMNSIPNRARTRPVTSVTTRPWIKNDTRFTTGKAVLPTNIKIATVEPVVRRPVTSNPTVKQQQQRNANPAPSNVDKSKSPRRRRPASKSPHPKNNSETTKQTSTGQKKVVVVQEPRPLEKIPDPQPEQTSETVAPKIARGSKSKSPRAKKRVPKVLPETKLPEEPEPLPEPELLSVSKPEPEVFPQVEVLPESEQEPEILSEAKIEVSPEFKPEPEVEISLEPESFPEYIPEYIPESEVLPEYLPELPQETHFKIVEVFENESDPQPITEREESNDNPAPVEPWSPPNIPTEKESFEVFGEYVVLSKSSTAENNATETGVDKDKKMLVDSWKETYLQKFDRYHGLV